LTALAVFGAAGVATRVEVLYVLGLVTLWLAFRRRIRWRTGGGVLVLAVLPVLIWQAWLLLTFSEASSYIGEAANTFDSAKWIDGVFYQFWYFIRIPAVISGHVSVNVILNLVVMLFMASLIVALRGYLGPISHFCAWLVLGYWLLHAFWYYETARYNTIVLPFGLIVFVEGAGRMWNLRRGWLAHGGTGALVIFALILVPVFWLHAADNIWKMTAAFNQQDRLPQNRMAIERSLQRVDPVPTTPDSRIFLTDLSLPEAIRLPGVVWLERPDYVSPPFPPGQAAAFVREKGITHLALKPPVNEWLRRNGQGIGYSPVYQGLGVWIARIESDQTPAQEK
jgi:hypothetical protein